MLCLVSITAEGQSGMYLCWCEDKCHEEDKLSLAGKFNRPASLAGFFWKKISDSMNG